MHGRLFGILKHAYNCATINTSFFSDEEMTVITDKGDDLLMQAAAAADIQTDAESFDANYPQCTIKSPRTCLLCDKTFKNHDHLRNHCEVDHTREYRCVLCKSGYTSVTTLLIHSAEHAAPRPTGISD